MTHDELCERAYFWLRGTKRCQFALDGPKAMSSIEIPDAIGWAGGLSIVVECKTSESDWYADGAKIVRKHPTLGMGRLRYLMVPKEMDGTIYPRIGGWGYLVVSPSRVMVRKEAEPFPIWDWRSELHLLALRAQFNYEGDHPDLESVAKRIDTSLAELKELRSHHE